MGDGDCSGRDEAEGRGHSAVQVTMGPRGAIALFWEKAMKQKPRGGMSQEVTDAKGQTSDLRSDLKGPTMDHGQR